MPNSNSAEYSWSTAEQRCFEYLLDRSGAVDGVTGHKGELPASVDVTSGKSVWMFEIQGGGEPLHPGPTERPCKSWRFGARIRGVFAARAEAQMFAGRILDGLPANEARDGIVGVQQLRITENPSIVRDVMPDQTGAGKDIRVWLLEMPMEVVFDNQDRVN